MTVFLPRENIFFIDEWLRYHIAVGFDHFYLFDNGGSRWVDCGHNLEVTARNKRFTSKAMTKIPSRCRALRGENSDQCV